MTHQSVEKKLHFVENDLFRVFIMRHVKNKILTCIYMQNSDGNLLKTCSAHVVFPDENLWTLDIVTFYA